MGLSKRVSIDPGDITHNQLPGRDSADAHPQEAITGLSAKLTSIEGKADTAITNAADAKSTAQAAQGTAAQAAADVDTLSLDVGDISQLQTTAKGSVVAAINENFTNAANGKTNVANAISGKGGTANSSMTFDQLAAAITAIPTPATPTGDAVAADVRTGKTFSNAVGTGIAGGLDLSLLIPSNLRKDITVDGKTGTLVPLTTEKRWANGSATLNGSGSITVSSLTFVPATIVIEVNGGGVGKYRVSYKASPLDANLNTNALIYTSSATTMAVTMTASSNGFTFASSYVPNAAITWIAFE
jgi:hypothetical protein